MGHSQVQNTYKRFDKNHKPFSPVLMKNYYDATPLYDEANEGIDSLVRGIVEQPSQKVDRLGSIFTKIHFLIQIEF